MQQVKENDVAELQIISIADNKPNEELLTAPVAIKDLTTIITNSIFKRIQEGSQCGEY